MLIKNVQVLRALAANGVLLSHLLIIEGKYGHGFKFLPDEAHVGACGVDLFFVISGFIMAMIAARDGSWTRFLFNRATRIYPPYWFYTTIVLLVFLVSPSMVNSSFDHPPSVWRSYFLIPDTVAPLLAVGWTLIHEMYFYICFAALLALGLRLHWGLLAWAALIVILNAVDPRIGHANSPVISLLSHPLTLEFIGGAFIGFAIQKGFRRLAPLALVCGIIALVAVFWLSRSSFNLVDNMNWQHVMLLGIPYSLVVYGAAAWEINKRSSVPRWIVSLGDASYSTYLGHVLVLSAIGRIFARTPKHGLYVETVFVVFCFVFANLIGVLSHRFIERPSLQFARRIALLTPASPAKIPIASTHA